MKTRRKPDARVEAILTNVYRSPAEERLASHLFGQFEISSFEISSSVGDEGQFVALLAARLHDCVGRMADEAWGRDVVRDYSRDRG